MKRLLILLSMILVPLAGCAAQPATTAPSPSPSPVDLSQYQLEYILIAEFPNIFWNDPDFYPIGRPGIEQQNADQQFSVIMGNQAEFSAILEHLSLDNKSTYSDEEKLLIYRQHKLLTLAIQMTNLSGGSYRFVLRVGEGQGELIQGTISAAGKLVIEKSEPSFNTHPICLAAGTMIDTPAGQVPVQDLKVGVVVWTLDKPGNRVAEPLVQTRATPVPDSFRVVSLTLADGRSLSASPGHPTADGRTVGQLRVGDAFGGAIVVKVELVTYIAGQTYDIMPAGGTGLYWANGILLKSTLALR